MSNLVCSASAWEGGGGGGKGGELYDCEQEPRDVNQESLSSHKNPNTDTILVIFFSVGC